MHLEQHVLGIDLQKVREIEAERDMLVARLEAEQRHDAKLVGRSGNAMLIAALTGTAVVGQPYDVWDLNRCERTYESAPPHLQRLMLPTLRMFRERVLARDEAWHQEAIRESYAPADTSPDREVSTSG